MDCMHFQPSQIFVSEGYCLLFKMSPDSLDNAAVPSIFTSMKYNDRYLFFG